MRPQNVADWMSTPPITVTPSTSMEAAQRLMHQQHVRRLPVVADGRLVGIITWGDLRAAQPSAATTLSVYEWRALLEKVTVAACMTRDPLTVAPGASVLEAAQAMLDRKVGGLPVVEDGRVVGVITESDLLRLLLVEFGGAERDNRARKQMVCHHCGAILRRNSFETLGENDQCWRCHYHLHRCDNCRYFDGVGCLLDRADHHTGVPGQHCSAFVYRAELASPVERAI
jgi:CBS domain-containing protein